LSRICKKAQVPPITTTIHSGIGNPIVDFCIVTKAPTTTTCKFAYSHKAGMGVCMIAVPEACVSVSEGICNELYRGRGVGDEDNVIVIWACVKEAKDLQSCIVDEPRRELGRGRSRVRIAQQVRGHVFGESFDKGLGIKGCPSMVKIGRVWL
jgi:hypothetical protein